LPIKDASVQYTVHQHDWWPVAAGQATALGDGTYRAVIPASVLGDGGRTWVQFTNSTTQDEAQQWVSTLVEPPSAAGATRLRLQLRVASVAVRAGRRAVGVRLALAGATRATSVVVSLRDARDRLLAVARRAGIGSSATLVVRPRRALARGRYRITVSARAGGRRLTARAATRVR
jgi:hypothetical protein